MCGLLFLCLPMVSVAQETTVALNTGVPEVAGRAEVMPVLVARTPGSIRGVVKDVSGATVAGAVVTLATGAAAGAQSVASSDDGVFTLARVMPGPYTLTVAIPGLDPWTRSGELGEGENLNLAEIAMAISPATVAVEVRATRAEVAQEQLRLEEKQRVLGVFPNFYATYLWDAAPLTARQKFSLAWKFSVDPVAFAMSGVVAGTEQSSNGFSGYGQGAQGYAKRFGAAYADGFTSTMLGQALFPAVFRQDPRYFVKGTGSIRSRALYAIATTVICKGDSGRWQLNYSNILGNAAAAGVSNLYYPSSSRNGARVTIQTSLITTASGALGGLMQEFFLHRMTPNVPDYSSVR